VVGKGEAKASQRPVTAATKRPCRSTAAKSQKYVDGGGGGGDDDDD